MLGVERHRDVQAVENRIVWWNAKMSLATHLSWGKDTKTHKFDVGTRGTSAKGGWGGGDTER